MTGIFITGDHAENDDFQLRMTGARFSRFILANSLRLPFVVRWYPCQSFIPSIWRRKRRPVALLLIDDKR